MSKMDKYYISWLGSTVLDTPAKWTELLPVNHEHFEQLEKITGIGYRPAYYDAESVDAVKVWPASRNYCVIKVWQDEQSGEEKLEIVKTA